MKTRFWAFGALSIGSFQLFQLVSLANTLTWTGTVSTDFHNATNWVPVAVPAAGDTLNIANGTVNISPAFSSSGTVNWTSGTISGALVITNGGLLAMSGANTKSLAGSITNYGTITFSNTGSMYFGANNLGVYNQAGALFDAQGDAVINSGGFTVLVTNAGTFRKSQGTNSTALAGVPFQNSGTLSALSGTLDLQSGGVLGGNWTASSGASLTFSGGAFTILSNAVSSGAGFYGVAGGSPSFAGTLGTTLDWSGGIIGLGSGGWTLATNGVLAISGANSKLLGESVTNNGTIRLSGTGTTYFNANNLGVYNQAGALFDAQGDAVINSGGFTVLVTNAGTFRKSQGTNSTALAGVPFQNSGTLSALSGTLDLQSGGVLGGNWTASSGASLTFSGGAFTILSSAASSGAGFIGVAGGNPSFAGTLGTTLDWSGGIIGTGSGGWTLATNGVLAISGANSKLLGESVTNNGTIRLSGTGTTYFNANNLGVYNQPGALFDAQGDAVINSGGFTVLVTNAGTFRKSQGTNSTALAGVPFQNSGTLSALSGTLSLQSGGTLGGNWTASSGASLTFSGGAFTILSNAASSGAGFIGVAGGNPSFVGTLGTTMDWTNGVIGPGGGWTIAVGGLLAISGGSTKLLGESVTNNGTITLSGTGALQYNAANVGIWNEPGALLDVQGDAAINSGGNAGASLLNAGTFRKSAGSNTCTISGIAIQNPGTWAAFSGVFSDSSPFTNSGTLKLSLNGPTNLQQFAFTGGLMLGGALQASIGNGFAPAPGGKVQIISSSSLGGNFSTVSIPVGLSELVSNNAVYLVATGTVPAELFNPADSAGGFVFSLGTASGQSYTVQRNDDLTTANWVFVTNFNGNGVIMQIILPAVNVPHRFFRVSEP